MSQKNAYNELTLHVVETITLLYLHGYKKNTVAYFSMGKQKIFSQVHTQWTHTTKSKCFHH
jgi:hypothetical protein